MADQDQNTRSVTLHPLDSASGYPVCPGLFDRNGAVPLGYEGAVSFTVHSAGATAVTLLLYHRGEEKPYSEIVFPKTYRIGSVWSMVVFGLDISQFEYAYSVDGPWNPEKGLLFDRQHELLDIYAKAVTGQRIWGKKDDVPKYRARVVRTSYDWDNDHQSVPMEDLVIYELHVRGFTMGKSAGVTAPGTFQGLREKIPYLKWLGITAVEMMPIFEFDEMQNCRHFDGKELIDYWGYNTVSYFAPNTSYCSEQEYNHEGDELRSLIRDLHAAGIQVILDVVFNHTAEGNEDGPFISFKGFDNNIYYMLTPDGNYYNFSGCGNTVNCNHPVVQELIVECLRYWTVNYHIDGFRFDLASILGRNEDGSPMEYPPLLYRLARDPLLSGVKLIAEAWDAGGMYQVGSFPAWSRWAEWNGKYRDALRSYLKGDIWMAPEAAKRMIGSPDLYSDKPAEQGRSPRGYLGYNSSVNFITCHDGFTLYDLYAYNGKHNEANGWGNSDGADDNRSWNCGEEGPSSNPEIEKLRTRMMKNAMGILLMSRGTPMFLAGDEFANTQFGNNNAYCQDNEISWLDWNYCDKNRDILEFTKGMIAFRKQHDCIRRDLKAAKCGFPNISVHAGTPWNALITKDTKAMYVVYAGYDENTRDDDIVCVCLNVWWEGVEIQLPDLPEGKSWHLVASTAGEERGMAWKRVVMQPRSLAVLVAESYIPPQR
ncbi:MAG: alpha-amylase family glycosyl hydrolase [Lachnospiraceae bacterium]|nr:alpha-amylase family glycosyl hydrolase [Lachnospiraceae bacterium]